MSHYYITDKNLKSDIRTFEYNYRGQKLTFISDLGVFSKDRLDFGTHVLLQTLPSFEDKKNLLDVGCGVGCLGISIAKVYPNVLVTMIDVNERCIELSKKNVVKNNVESSVFKSDLYENVNDKFDVIVSNPPIRAGKKIVFGVVERGYEHLNDGGEIYVVIQKKQGADSLKKKLEDVFKNVSVLNKEKGYYIFKSVK